MPTPFSIEDADRIAHDYFLSHYQDSGGTFHPVRAAELPKYGKVYYHVRPVRHSESSDADDAGYLGDGGFLVALATGHVERFASADLMGAWGILRARHGLPSGVEPPVEALAEVLASYPNDELRRHVWLAMVR